MARLRLKINGVQYKGFRQLRITKERNKLGYIEFVLYNIEPSDYTSNITYNSKITVEEFDTVYTEIFKGYVRNVEKISYRKSKVTGFSPAVKLFDRTWDTRQQYTNIATNTILINTVGSIMGIGTNDITTIITTRFELDNKLRSVAQLANINGAEWWEDEDGLGADRINLSSTRYDTTSVDTITIGSNCAVSKDNVDSDKIFNCITVLGRGDGINQVKALTYGFAFYQPTLTADVTQTGNEFFVSDASGFATTNGIVFINNEKIKFANRTGLRCYNLTVWDGSSWVSRTALNGAYAHSSGLTVWYVGDTGTEYTKDSPAPGSSVATYGIREYTHFDKRIVQDVSGDPFETCGIIAKVLFDKFNTPVRTIILQKRKLLLGNLEVGKTVTVVDSQTALNANFKIHKLELNDARGRGKGLKITVNNVLHDFSTSIDELKKDMETDNTYGQGATNLYQVNNSENVDTSFPMNLRFYMPPEAVAVNSVKLNFKMKNYRADSESVTGAPNFSQHSAGWFSHGLAAIGFDLQLNNGFIRNIVQFTQNNCVTNLSFSSASSFMRNPTLTQGFVYADATIVSYTPAELGGGYLSTATTGNWYYRSMLTGWATQTALTNWSYTDRTLLSSIGYDDVSVLTGYSTFAWSYPLFSTVDAPNISGTFDKIKVAITIHNGFNETKTPTVNLIREDPGGGGFGTLSITTVATYTPTIDAYGYWFVEYETTSDKRGSTYKVEIPTSSGFDVNKTASPDSSYILLNVATYLKSTDALTYGIVENSSEFTPPGTVTVEIGEDGGSLTTLGTYTDDQDDLELSDTIDFEKGKWYNIRITPTAGSYNGRMRIEASTYIQIYIESE